MEESEQDKSELPSTFKLHRARTRGSVARGMDLGFLTGLAAFLVYMWIGGAGVGNTMLYAVRMAFVNGPGVADGDGVILGLFPAMTASLIPPLAFMAGTIFCVVALFELVQTGVVFSAYPLKPDFSRLNPAKGLKRLFSIRMLIETAKNVLKLVVYALITGLLVKTALEIRGVRITDAASLRDAMVTTGLSLIAAFVLAAMVFAVLDQLIVRKDFLKRMRMSRREVRRENRDREGEPRLKQKRKQLHGEFVRLSQSIRNLRGADVLIANPEHIALALRYDPATMHAPVIASIGTNRIAQRLRRLAFLYNIPIIENRALARALLRHGKLNMPIPEACYSGVADAYNMIRAGSGAKAAGDATAQRHAGASA